MSTGMLGLQNCPRSVAELKGLPRGVRFRLAMQLNMFADEHQELAFNGATDDQQCEALAAGLASWDQHNGVAGGSPEQQMQMPAPQPPQQMQMQLPPQPSMQQQVQVPQQQQQQPQFAPPQFAPPQQPAIQPPVQPPAQPQFAPPQGMQPSMGAPPQQQQQQPPRNPQPSMGMPPAIQPPAMAPPPQAPPQQPPPQPQMAPQQPPTPPPVEMPARQPATSADPGNQGGAALPILRGMADTLKALAAANGTNQKWLEQLHEQSLGHAKMFEILLTMFLVFCEQQGLDQKTMAGLCKQVTDEQRASFLGKLDPQGKG